MKYKEEFVECKLVDGQANIHVNWSNPDIDVTLTQTYKSIPKTVYEAYISVLETKKQPKKGE